MPTVPVTNAHCLGRSADASQASAWVRRWSHLVPPQGVVLDVACGQGRHLAWFFQRGHRVVGVDRSETALAALGLPTDGCETVLADIEQGPWPFEGRLFEAVVVTNYLWRPLLPTLAASLAPGGVLMYETFAQGQEQVGKPSRPDFLLAPGELLTAFGRLRVVAFEDGFETSPQAPAPGRFVQRIVAVRPSINAHPPGGAAAPAYLLHAAPTPLP